MKPIHAILIAFALFLFLLAVYLFLIYVSKKRKKETLKFANYRYAHRGLHGKDAPENSLSAFKRAIDAGFAIELDVRLSRDGTLVVFHDDDLDRMTKETGRVDLKTAEELSRISLLGSKEKIPTFDEVLSLVDGRVPLLVEIKEAKGSLAVTERVCERLKSYTGSYLIESFNPLALKRVRKLMPNAIIGILCEYFTKKPEFRTRLFYLLQSMITNVLSRPDFVAYCHEHSAFLPFRLVRMMGAVSFAYTVREQKSEDKALKAAFDTVIFEGYTPNSPYINPEKNK